jgi:AraC family transcriptional regulator
MIPRIENLAQKKLIGIRLSMSFSNNKTGELWQKFMPDRSKICHKVNNDLISLQVYEYTHFSNFNPDNEFEKWAAIEVKNFVNVPEPMETFILEGGLYAVFDYKGLSNDPSIFQYIFGTWLPSSDYDLDDRPHFEVLGDGYRNNDPNSEEEIWIPIKPKS